MKKYYFILGLGKLKRKPKSCMERHSVLCIMMHTTMHFELINLSQVKTAQPL